MGKGGVSKGGVKKTMVVELRRRPCWGGCKVSAGLSNEISQGGILKEKHKNGEKKKGTAKGITLGQGDKSITLLFVQYGVQWDLIIIIKRRRVLYQSVSPFTPAEQ